MPPSMEEALGLARLTAGWCLIGSWPKMPPEIDDALLLRRAEGSGWSGACWSLKVKASFRTMGAPAMFMSETFWRGVVAGRETGASTWLYPPKTPPSIDDLVTLTRTSAGALLSAPKMPPSIEEAPMPALREGGAIGASEPKMPVQGQTKREAQRQSACDMAKRRRKQLLQAHRHRWKSYCGDRA